MGGGGWDWLMAKIYLEKVKDLRGEERVQEENEREQGGGGEGRFCGVN